MSLRKSISNTFTVTTLVDGESAPYYFEEKYAWSNDSSTQSVTTPPSISGGWQTSIPPSNGYAYLWRMSIRHVWNESTRSYTQEAAQYFRMSGTNGTSIHIKGHVSTVQNLPTTHVDGDAYVVDANGHLYMWSDESGSWVDIGVFQGEAGKTYYTHIAWASQVNYSGTTVTSVDGFITDKSPNDTTHMWMGVYIDEQSGQDVSNALRYTWSYTKGNKGYDAVTYGFVFTEAFAKADKMWEELAVKFPDAEEYALWQRGRLMAQQDTDLTGLAKANFERLIELVTAHEEVDATDKTRLFDAYSYLMRYNVKQKNNKAAYENSKKLLELQPDDAEIQKVVEALEKAAN